MTREEPAGEGYAQPHPCSANPTERRELLQQGSLSCRTVVATTARPSAARERRLCPNVQIVVGLWDKVRVLLQRIGHDGVHVLDGSVVLDLHPTLSASFHAASKSFTFPVAATRKALCRRAS